MRHHALALAIFCACLTLASCGGDKDATLSQQTGEESLPQPGAPDGSVTGMPNPGTPSVLPLPAGDMATDSEDADTDTEVTSEEVTPADPYPTPAPRTIMVDGVLGKSPADSMPPMPVMPANPPPLPEDTE